MSEQKSGAEAAVKPRWLPRVPVTLSTPDYCTCCERTLNDTGWMLELDQRTWTYHDFEGVPADKSQGWFVFGMKCAKAKLAEHHKKTAPPMTPEQLRAVVDDLAALMPGAKR
jgi:hypothetical protein